MPVPCLYINMEESEKKKLYKKALALAIWKSELAPKTLTRWTIGDQIKSIMCSNNNGSQLESKPF